MSFKEDERKKESKYKFIEFVILTLFTISGSLHCFWGFKLPFGIISLLQYNFASTRLPCAVILKYITFLYVIGTTIQLFTYCFIQLLFKLAKTRKKKKNIFILS